MKEKVCNVIGVGYSAGGLTAIRTLFSLLPAEPQAAFVVVYHIQRDVESKLRNILSKHTSMPVHLIEQHMALQNNHVYLLPAGQYVTLSDNRLQLSQRPLESNINWAIDTFFTSLASEKKERAIGVILSGTGQDGARGIAAIHQQGGKTLIQSPASAEFGTMPMHAILADDPVSIASAEQLAKDLAALLVRKYKNDTLL